MLRVPDRRLSRVHEPRFATDRVEVHEPAPDGASVPEALVQDLWDAQRFDRTDLTETSGAPVRVLDPGQLNTDAGPDFSHAHIQIDGIDWYGDVEIHVTSRSWLDHGHDEDPRYDRVVLHVTLHPDLHTGSLPRSDGSIIPEIILAPRLRRPLRSLLRSFYRRDRDDLVCAPQWDDVPKRIRRTWIDTLGRKRLYRRAKHLRERLRTGTPPATVLHERLFAGLGYAKNTSPMMDLARRTPPSVLRDISDPTDREALLLGIAGLLPEPSKLLTSDRETADAVMNLRARFARLHAHRPVPIMKPTAWTSFRLRPNNLPPLRIAQAAAWFGESGLFSTSPVDRLREAACTERAIPTIRNLLTATPTSFWRTHYRLTARTKEHSAALGRSRIDTLIVNAVAPLLLALAEYETGDGDNHEDHARGLLDLLPAKRDSVIRRFRDLGTRARSASEAQGMHELFRNYCSSGGCLQCDIGRHLLSRPLSHREGKTANGDSAKPR
ncbi:hypothetical protein CRI94_07565 [Longibacter salinarum]|uniref:DUF2851 domain-containing protein n=1 Tax=Longibacter salinarum TaxID=1850348 RepID=A0A2A8CYZ1_9BACT|nr:DUF2851 family protein [Longibacter salinarum]PEN13905.1 hypothetical protein CRI94_07565 [Longibacter salinarum]